MKVELSKREAALVLAALRNWQEESATTDLADYYEAYFEEHEPLDRTEIDAVCGWIGAIALALPDEAESGPYIRHLYIRTLHLHVFYMLSRYDLPCSCWWLHASSLD